jgi:beta-phosphoglucomutase
LRQCTPTFEKEFLVNKLKREGYLLAVCSNAVRESVEMMLRGSGIFELFDYIASNEDVKNPKPDPEIYLNAFERMKLKPEECVIVEDAGHGVEAARRSGAHVCQVSGFYEVDYERIRGFIDLVSKEKK